MRSRRVLALALAAVLTLCAACGRRNAIPAPPAGSPPLAVTSGRTLTITFWNVEWFPGRRPNAGERAQASHVAAVVPIVERLDPDVLGLEEVSDADGARLIADHLKGFRVDVCTEFTRAPTNEPSRQQTALCSRLPLLASGWEPWQPTAAGLQPRRGFVFAAYQPTPGEVLLVYGVHLKSNVPDEPGGDATNRAMREESARQLVVHERASAARYASQGRVRLEVVGGDMNTSLDDSRFEPEQTCAGGSTGAVFVGGGTACCWNDGTPCRPPGVIRRRVSTTFSTAPGKVSGWRTAPSSRPHATPAITIR